jgi:hypothetical protein
VSVELVSVVLLTSFVPEILLPSIDQLKK